VTKGQDFKALIQYKPYDRFRPKPCAQHGSGLVTKIKVVNQLKMKFGFPTNLFYKSRFAIVS
jgi:hypothetical protein